MTRRKKPPPQHKLRQITDSSGWTHVIKGPPGITDPKTTNLHLDHGKRTETNYTLETYLDKFQNHYVPIWRKSECFKNLSRIFEQEILPTIPNMQITQCICLGLGSMTTGSEDSSHELAALISMLEILEKTHPIHQPPIFQDPIFTPLDIAILQRLGYTVLSTPAAFSALNSATFLFAPHLECYHYATALEIATPALYVGSELGRYADGLLSVLAEDMKRGSCRIFRAFLEMTEGRGIPSFDRTSWCESICIHWLKSTEDDSRESIIEQDVRSMKIV